MWDEYAIVEDNKFDQLIAERIIKTVVEEPTISLFDTGRPALEYFLSDKFQGKNVLILLDINMPEMDGHEFIKGLRESEFSEDILGRIKVIVMTSSIRSDDRTEMIKFPFILDYIEKPITRDKLRKFWQ